jgi:cytochrome c5
MKKVYLFLAMIGLVLFFTASVLSPVKPTGKKSTTVVAPTSSIPDDLKVIFKNSCMACHSNDGSHMAMTMLNFSDWDNSTPAKQAKKAAAICKMITKGAMPPKSFREANPDAVPTESQKAEICKWSETLTQN